MSCIDFGLTSYCSTVSNVATLCGNPQNFLTWQIAGYNHPSFGGCQFFQNKINNWTNTLANVTGMAYRRQLKAKIDWANCMLSECCGQPNGPVIYGCMDDGNKGNDYLNNQGTNANPQFGSVTPGTPALNYYGAAQIDSGICIYSQPTQGCKDPAALNYDPNADMDCGNNTVSDFNIHYTNWQGIQPPGSWTPYGDTSCCTYTPPFSPPIEYNWRDGDTQATGGFKSMTPTFVNINIPQSSNYGDAVIGYDHYLMFLNYVDATGNAHGSPYNTTGNQFGNSSQGYTITMWDYNGVFLGKWHYQNVTSFQSYLWNGFRLFLSGVTHLAGPSPQVWLGEGPYGTIPSSSINWTGSSSMAFMKLENAATTPSSFAPGSEQLNPGPGPNSTPVACTSQISGYLGPGPCYPTYISTFGYSLTNSSINTFPDQASCNAWGCGSSSTSKMASPDSNGTELVNEHTIITKAIYNNSENQSVEIVNKDNIILNTEENNKQITVAFGDSLIKHSTKNIFNITFKTKDGYYYSKSPSLIMNFPGSENYKIKVESEMKNARGYIVEKTFSVNYTSSGFEVFEEDRHNIEFITKITKEVDTSIETKVKEIKELRVDTSTVSGNGGPRNISVVGTPGSTFSLTIKDKNGRNVLPYSNKIIKTAMIAISASSTLKLNNAVGLEVGMVVLNDQKRGVKITGISDPVKTNVDAINETSTTHVSISSFLTFAANDNIVFAKETDITEVEIPDSGVYSFTQDFPPLEKFKRTINGEVFTDSVAAVLDYTKDLEKNMKVTGTGVDGNDAIISSITDDTKVVIVPAQSIDDRTELTFEMPDNRYDITLYPLMAVLGDDIPRYSSEDCDTLPTYSIYQYVDPIVQIVPSSALSNVTTTGTITLTGKANKGAGTNGDIAINMVATKSDGSLIKSREPRFSSVDSESSDFSNTLNTVVKKVREGDCRDKDIVHLNNVTGIRVGMIVTGDDIDANKTITVKSITGVAVELSEKQTIRKDSALTFSSMFNMHISGLTATLSPNGGLANGICTVTGKGQITTFGIDSFTSTFSFDNFLSV